MRTRLLFLGVLIGILFVPAQGQERQIPHAYYVWTNEISINRVVSMIRVDQHCFLWFSEYFSQRVATDVREVPAKECQP